MSALTAVQCLAAVARHHGLSVVAESLVHEHNLGTEEPSVPAVLRMAEANRLKSQAQQMDWDGLFALESVFPLMVRLQDGRYGLVAGLNRLAESPSVAVLLPGSAGAQIQQLSRSQFCARTRPTCRRPRLCVAGSCW